MKSDAVRVVLGAVLNLEIWCVLSCNIVCLLCIYRGRLHLQNENPVFVVTSLNMLVECLQLLIHLVYLGPAIWIGDWIFQGQDSLGVTVAATGFLWCWFLCSLNQILMASNRLSVVCFPRLKLSKNVFIYAFIVMAILATGMIVYSGFISPCCRMTPDPEYFGYSYLAVTGQTENYSMKYVDLPIDIIASVFCIVSYATLFVYIIKLKHSAHDQARVQAQEIRLCIQFLIVYLTYNFTWGSFFLFPMLGIPYPEAYATTTVLFVANCGINSIILLLLNKEIHRELRNLFGMTKSVPVVPLSMTAS